MYVPRIEALATEGPFTSKDVDFLGDKEAVKECARRLKLGRAIFDPPFSRDVPINTGIVTYVDDDGVERTIDFLASIMGPDAAEVRDTAPAVGIEGEAIRVMHPVLCILARGPLILRLGRTDEHTLMQLRAIILCAREFLADLLAAGHVRQVYKWNERLFWYATKKDGIEIYKRFNIDVSKAILLDDRLSEEFRSRRYPQMCARIRAKRGSTG